MRKAKVIKEHKDYPELKLDDIVFVHAIDKGNAEYCCSPYILIETMEGLLFDIPFYKPTNDLLQMLDGPNQLSKEIQVQAILFEGQCRLQVMIANNEQGKEDEENGLYDSDDFYKLQEEIQRRINDLNKEK